MSNGFYKIQTTISNSLCRAFLKSNPKIPVGRPVRRKLSAVNRHEPHIPIPEGSCFAYEYCQTRVTSPGRPGCANLSAEATTSAEKRIQIRRRRVVGVDPLSEWQELCPDNVECEGFTSNTLGKFLARNLSGDGCSHSQRP